MRNTLYRQMVYWINAHRTWIEVADDNLYEEHIISRSDRTDYLVSRTLVLRAFKANGTYLEGTTWEKDETPLSAVTSSYGGGSVCVLVNKEEEVYARKVVAERKV